MLRYLQLRYLLLITLGLLIATVKVNAHPHVWIDLRIKPLMDEQGALLGLEQAWRFDPFYSLVLLEELEKGGPEAELEERYDQLALEIVNNLNEVSFFTQGFNNQAPSQWNPVAQSTLLRVGQRIELRFFLPLQNPLPIEELPFSYQVYDPTYYIEMLHALEVGLDKSALKTGCHLSLETPTPSADLIQKALALDKKATSDDSQLGKYFAEQVTLSCSQ